MEQNSKLARLGYNPDDFFYERVEFPNCVHESVAPKGYARDPNWKRPADKAKEYAFVLDKF